MNRLVILSCFAAVALALTDSYVPRSNGFSSDAAAVVAAEDAFPMHLDDASRLLWVEGYKVTEDTCWQDGTEDVVAGEYSGTYNRLPKAGSGFVKRLIEGTGLDDHFRLEKEFDPMQPDDTQRFTIGSVRNPCNYYVSLYSYGVIGHGEIRHELGHKYYKANDTATFKKWLTRVMQSKKAKNEPSEGPGIESIRFIQSYSSSELGLKAMTGSLSKIGKKQLKTYSNALKAFDPSSVKCWVKTENILEDVKTCLSRYQSESGVQVDWAKFNNSAATIWQNPSRHKACKDFFDDEAEAFVRSTDKYIFQHFNYETCCS
eukprot:NODE_11551_length_1279_cov_3.455729.p1 GENE.NODE_11551_length_1279_cov_3.455729~~NODE_11551_length_1279_cov_3.455729.p1  ORF type:complete len:316 (-),score=93.88 NODE_11551_length_1279_cov_3.455729:260-1207(-)